MSTDPYVYWTTAHRPCIAEKYADELAKFVASTNDVDAIDKKYREHLTAMDLTVAEAVMYRDMVRGRIKLEMNDVY